MGKKNGLFNGIKNGVTTVTRGTANAVGYVASETKDSLGRVRDIGTRAIFKIWFRI